MLSLLHILDIDDAKHIQTDSTSAGLETAGCSAVPSWPQILQWICCTLSSHKATSQPVYKDKAKYNAIRIKWLPTHTHITYVVYLCVSPAP